MRTVCAATCLFGICSALAASLVPTVPGTSWLKRVLQTMLEGITLGTLTQAVLHPVTGYLAFFTVALFLIGVFLLPNRVARAYSSESQLVAGAGHDLRT